MQQPYGGKQFQKDFNQFQEGATEGTSEEAAGKCFLLSFPGHPESVSFISLEALAGPSVGSLQQWAIE